jgi:uncharacterized membrane protein
VNESLTRNAILATLLYCSHAVGAAPAAPTFQHDVRPIFEAKCMKCHGAEKKKGGLDLRTLSSALAGGSEGTPIVPGQPDKSLLWQQIVENEMPPEDEKPLTEQERAVIRQ